jgi:hypothetical protein
LGPARRIRTSTRLDEAAHDGVRGRAAIGAPPCRLRQQIRHRAGKIRYHRGA